MGWLFMQSLGAFSGPTAYLDAQFTSDRPERRSRVLRSALVSMRTYYSAVEVVRPDRDREVFAAVCLVKYNPRDREGYIFGYKEVRFRVPGGWNLYRVSCLDRRKLPSRVVALNSRTPQAVGLFSSPMDAGDQPEK